VRIAAWFGDSPDYELRCIVPVVPEPSWTASLNAWARDHGVPLVESGDYRDVRGEGQIANLGFSVFYDKIVDAGFIAGFDRLLNLHNGPLPRYRGVSPINWALKNGETSHGVTIHEITPGIDDGPVISQLTYSIYPEFDEVADVYGRALEYAWVLFQQTMPLIDKIRPVPQDESRATYYSRTQDDLLGERRSFTRPEPMQTLAAVDSNDPS
jgi:methionyl-tRNA formyltransferase